MRQAVDCQARVLRAADPDRRQLVGDLGAFQVCRGQVGQAATDEDVERFVRVSAHGLVDDGLRAG
jgi:hypothetical protein